VSSLDALFVRFVLGLLIILVLYGVGMTAVVLWGSEPLGLRMITGFSAMFTGILGLGSGYLLGRSGPDPKERADEPRAHV
jgi:hypothetical protein